MAPSTSVLSSSLHTRTHHPPAPPTVAAALCASVFAVDAENRCEYVPARYIPANVSNGFLGEPGPHNSTFALDGMPLARDPLPPTYDTRARGTRPRPVA